MAGVNDLFAIVLIFKTMLSKESFRIFYGLLDTLIQDLSSRLTTISILQIEADMGFIPNWRDIK